MCRFCCDSESDYKYLPSTKWQKIKIPVQVDVDCGKKKNVKFNVQYKMQGCISLFGDALFFGAYIEGPINKGVPDYSVEVGSEIKVKYCPICGKKLEKE